VTVPPRVCRASQETRCCCISSHTSGLPDTLENNTELRRAHAPLAKFVQHGVRDTVPLFPAGTQLSYQSVGTNLTAEIVRIVSGLPIADFLQQEIFDKLGLKSIALGSQSLDRKRLVRVQTPEYQEPAFGWNSAIGKARRVGGGLSARQPILMICQLMLGLGRR
jgi:CubicO group peptidase (beta-lactamase class C family)